MNELDVFNRVAQTALNMAGSQLPGWDNVFIPLGFVMSAWGAFAMYAMQDDLIDKKKGVGHIENALEEPHERIPQEKEDSFFDWF